MNTTKLIHPEGWRFIGIFSLITLIFGLFSQFLCWICFALTIWCAYFFRNPVRVTPPHEGLIMSPADGKIVLIKEVEAPSELELGTELYTRVSIFLNVFDVHINRIPISGTIKKIVYHPGRFLNASLDKASIYNERNSIVVNTKYGDIAFVQIAGLIARRIRCDVNVDETVTAGNVYGLIRFGSRMDVYIPKTVDLQVYLGQRMIAGETVLAKLTSEITLDTEISL